MSEEAPVYIYALIDPDTGAVRYIGSSTDPEKRVRGHMGSPSGMAMLEWITGLLERGQAPIMRVIDQAEQGRRLAVERRWIRRFGQRVSLLNVALTSGHHRSRPRDWPRRNRLVAPSTISVNLTPAAVTALQWLIDQGETVSSATRTALVALAQARGMGSADIEARVAAIEATVDELRQSHRMTRGG